MRNQYVFLRPGDGVIGYGTFRNPKHMLPYTYVELQQFIVERRRRLQQGHDRVGTVGDLAAKLRAFASDAIVVKHLIEFALPPKKRSDAAEVTAKVVSAAAENQNTRK